MLEIRLLGQFSVTLDGKPLEISTHEGRVLLAYLVLKAGKSQRHDQLARLVNERTVEFPNLESELTSLTGLLGKDRTSGSNFIRTEDSSVSFSQNSDYWLDANILDLELQGKPQLKTLMDQLAQVGGELLPGYSEPWIILERERLRGNFENKIRYLLEQLLGQGKWDEALEWGERWIAMGKAPEAAFQALMLANAGKNDLPAVVSIYQRCRRSLKEDFGLEPSNQIQETILWILQGGSPDELEHVDLGTSPSIVGVTEQVRLPDEADEVAARLRQTGHFPLGTLLNERYRLEEEIGEGGTGIVYCGFDIFLERNVAIKVLNPALYSTEASKRIMSEALAIARLNHPNIVVIHDAGEAYGTFYLVLEYIPAGTLAENMPTSIEEALQVALYICAALSQVHQLGIIHRDLKPENVMITQDGTAKLMDFGLARFDASRFTQEGNILGTVYYMAPEQALGQEIDYRADLYALGVMLYEMTSGELPFSGDDALTVITQHLYKTVKPPSQINPQVFPKLEELTLDLLQKSPEDRPSSADEVAQEINKLLSREEKVAPPEVHPARDRQKLTPPGIIWDEEIEAGLRGDDLQAVHLLVRRWREQGRRTLDIASMAIILNSPNELTFDQQDAVLLLRSALYHEVNLEPWLKRVSTQEDAITSLQVILEEYPKPHIRSKIVSGLIELGGDQATQLLLEIATSDDSPEVRSAAAVAAARQGQLEQVVKELQTEMASGENLAAEAAFVAVMDEIGLPEELEPYPKFAVAAALARKRLRSPGGRILGQAGRSAAGAGLILALNGLFSPFYVALSFPSDYQNIINNVMPLQLWMISGALGSMLLGAPQGFASGFITGLSDALWRGRNRRMMRLILGSLSGLVLALTILLLQPADPEALSINLASYNVLYILYGLVMGAIITVTIPRLGDLASWSLQMVRSLQAAALAAAATLLLLFLIYRGDFYLYIPARLFISVLLPIGIALSLVRRKN